MFPFVFPTGSIPDEIGLFIPLALLIGVFAILLVRRRDGAAGDDGGTRYVATISLVTLFVALFAAFVAVQALTDLAVDHQQRAAANQELAQSLNAEPSFYPGTGPGGPITTLSIDPTSLYAFTSSNDSNYNTAVASGLAALTTGAVFLYHRRRRARIIGAPDMSPGAEAVNRTYLQSVKAVAALTIALAGAAALYGIWELIAPGIAGSVSTDVGRMEGLSTFLASGSLTLATALIFVRAEHELQRG